MRIGFDVDGVLAAFIPAYQRETIKAAGGLNLFHPEDVTNPPTWHWPQYRGYQEDLFTFPDGPVWSAIIASPTFWLDLGETEWCGTVRMMVQDLARRHEIYFITNRTGHDVKWQTELWLELHLGLEKPTVLISSAKGMCCAALKLDVYVDDNLDNANDCAVRSPKTRTYLVNRNYNQGDLARNESIGSPVTRVRTLGEMFDAELVNL